MITAAEFKTTFPEFASADTPMVEFYLGLSRYMLAEDRFGDSYPYAVGLFVAHHLAMELPAIRAANAGQVPGVIGSGGFGAVASKAVGSVSVSYQAIDASAYEPNAGHWALSVYGMRYLSMIRLFGAVAYQL